jgi:hypothetical protein
LLLVEVRLAHMETLSSWAVCDKFVQRTITKQNVVLI